MRLKMKQIIKFLKKMSVENALFFFSMFGVAMMAFAFMGGNMRFLDEGLAICQADGYRSGGLQGRTGAGKERP